MSRAQKVMLGVFTLIVLANLSVWSARKAQAEQQDPRYNKLCQVVHEPNFPSYCYGWPFGYCPAPCNL